MYSRPTQIVVTDSAYSLIRVNSGFFGTKPIIKNPQENLLVGLLVNRNQDFPNNHNLRILYSSLNRRDNIVLRSKGIQLKRDLSKVSEETFSFRGFIRGPNETEAKYRDITFKAQKYLNNQGGWVFPSWFVNLQEELNRNSSPDQAWHLITRAQAGMASEKIKETFIQVSRAGSSIGQIGSALREHSEGRINFMAGEFKVHAGMGMVPESVLSQMKSRPAEVFDRLNPKFQVHITMLRLKTKTGAELWRLGFHELQGDVIYRDNDGEWEELRVVEDSKGNAIPWISNWPEKGTPGANRAIGRAGYMIPQHVIHFMTGEEVVTKEMSFFRSLTIDKLLDPSGRLFRAAIKGEESPFNKWANSVKVYENRPNMIYQTKEQVWKDIVSGAGSKDADIGLVTNRMDALAMWKTASEYENLSSADKMLLEGDPGRKKQWIDGRRNKWRTYYGEDVIERSHMANPTGIGNKLKKAEEVDRFNKVSGSVGSMLTLKKTTNPNYGDRLKMLEYVMDQEGDFIESIRKATSGFDLLKKEEWVTRFSGKMEDKFDFVKPVSDEGSQWFKAITSKVHGESGKEFALFEFHNLNVSQHLITPELRKYDLNYKALIRRDPNTGRILGTAPRFGEGVRTNILMPVMDVGPEGSIMFHDPAVVAREILGRMDVSVEGGSRKFGDIGGRFTVEGILGGYSNKAIRKLASTNNMTVEGLINEINSAPDKKGKLIALVQKHDIAEYSAKWTAINKELNEILGSVTREANAIVSPGEEFVHISPEIEHRLAGIFIFDSKLKSNTQSAQLSILKLAGDKFESENGVYPFGSLRKFSNKQDYRWSFMSQGAKKEWRKNFWIPFDKTQAKNLTQSLDAFHTTENIAIVGYGSEEDTALWEKILNMRREDGVPIYKPSADFGVGVSILTSQGEDLIEEARRSHVGEPVSSPFFTDRTPIPVIDPNTGETIRWVGEGQGPVEDPYLKFIAGGVKAQELPTGELNVRGYWKEKGTDIHRVITLNAWLNKSPYAMDSLIEEAQKHGYSLEEAIEALKDPQRRRQLLESLGIEGTLNLQYGVNQSKTLGALFATQDVLHISSEQERRPAFFGINSEVENVGMLRGGSGVYAMDKFGRALAELGAASGGELSWMADTDQLTDNPYAGMLLAELGRENMWKRLGEIKSSVGTEGAITGALKALQEGLESKGANSAKLAGWMEVATQIGFRLR